MLLYVLRSIFYLLLMFVPTKIWPPDEDSAEDWGQVVIVASDFFFFFFFSPQTLTSLFSDFIGLLPVTVYSMLRLWVVWFYELEIQCEIVDSHSPPPL